MSSVWERRIKRLLRKTKFRLRNMYMKELPRLALVVLAAILLVSCGPSGKIWPSNRIGPMWVNRYGHSNSQPLWEYCNVRMTDKPGLQTTDCAVPWVDELFIGYGVRGLDKTQRDALWAARTWELSIDGHAVDLPAFNILDFNSELDGKKYEYRLWRIRLREISEGKHSLHYVMHVNQEISNDPDAQAPGTYELVVNFTFGKK